MMLLMHPLATQYQTQETQIHLLNLEPCMVIPQKASIYKTSRNMLKKTQSISNCSISFYRDFLPTGVNYQTHVDNPGASVSIFLWMTN